MLKQTRPAFAVRHPLVAAGVAQALGLFAAVICWQAASGLPVFAAVNKLWAGVFLQGVFASCSAALLGAPWWWRLIHLVFMPLSVWVHGLLLPVWIWPTGLVLLLLIFGWTGFSRAPLYLTDRTSYAAVLQLLPEQPCRMADLGCGDGALLRALAKARPECVFVGIEQAPLWWFWAWLAARGLPNLHIVRGDIWRHSLAGYDLVYAFLSPAPMQRLWQKANVEMSSGAQLISNRFPVPGVAPRTTRQTAARHDRLYCYMPVTDRIP